MAKRKLTIKKRSEFALLKTLMALRWVAISDISIYAITQVLDVSGLLQLSTTTVLVLRLVLNILVYATAKFSEGEDK